MDLVQKQSPGGGMLASEIAAAGKMLSEALGSLQTIHTKKRNLCGLGNPVFQK